MTWTLRGTATYGVGVDCDDIPTVKEFLLENTPASEVIQDTYIENLHIIPSDITLSVVEQTLSSIADPELQLRSRLDNVSGYNYIVIDCAPSLGLLTANSIVAADEIVVPVALTIFSLKGIEGLFEVVQNLNDELRIRIGHRTNILGVLLTFIDKRTKLSKEMLRPVSEELEDYLLNSAIPQNVKIGESQVHRKSVLDYAPDSKGAKAYLELTNEILSQLEGVDGKADRSQQKAKT